MFLFQLSLEIILTCVLTVQYLYYIYFILVLVGGSLAESIITIISRQRTVRAERNRKTDEDIYIYFCLNFKWSYIYFFATKIFEQKCFNNFIIFKCGIFYINLSENIKSYILVILLGFHITHAKMKRHKNMAHEMWHIVIFITVLILISMPFKVTLAQKLYKTFIVCCSKKL